MIRMEEVAKQVYDLAISDDPLAPLVKEALDVIDEGLDVCGEQHVSISFNGGKDCTVLLHLFAGALGKRRASSDPSTPIPALYIAVPSPFPVLEQFIEQATKDYNLDLFYCRPPQEDTVETVVTPAPGEIKQGHDYLNPLPRPRGVGKAKGGEGMRQALDVYKLRNPQISGILIGTRRTDPHGDKISHRCPTDAGWPQFERINPIINWGYGDVWTFLRQLKVPYCTLYDEGYTSLGSTYNTFPNPALLITPSTNTNEHAPHSASSIVSPSTALTTVMSSTHAIPQSEALSPTEVLSNYMSATHTSLDGVLSPSPEQRSPSTGANLQPVFSSPPQYRPAYLLKDGHLERAGRGLNIAGVAA